MVLRKPIRIDQSEHRFGRRRENVVVIIKEEFDMKTISRVLLGVCLVLTNTGCSSSVSEPAASSSQTESSEAAAPEQGSGTTADDAGGSNAKQEAAETAE